MHVEEGFLGNSQGRVVLHDTALETWMKEVKSDSYMATVKQKMIFSDSYYTCDHTLSKRACCPRISKTSFARGLREPIAYNGIDSFALISSRRMPGFIDGEETQFLVAFPLRSLPSVCRSVSSQRGACVVPVSHLLVPIGCLKFPG